MTEVSRPVPEIGKELASVEVRDADIWSAPEATPDQEDEEPDEEVQQRYALLRAIKQQGGAEEFVQSLSQQLLLQQDVNWGDLLGAAPKALCHLGQCFVAATSSVAVSSLALPQESGLPQRTLRANLVHCSDLGRIAFTTAESKMSRVHLTTNYICEPNGPIDKILKLLDDDQLVKVDLKRQLDRLKMFSERCVKDAAQVKEKFGSWQDCAILIRRACTAADDNLESERVSLRNNRNIAALRSEHQALEKERTQLETAEIREHVKIHQDEYQQAAKAVPKGWTAITQDAVTWYLNLVPDLFARSSFTSPWISLKQRRDDDESEEHAETAYAMISNPHEDHGFRLCIDMTRPLHVLRAQLSNGDNAPPNFGVDWNSLYGFPTPSQSGGLSDMSIDVTLGIFRSLQERTLSEVMERRSLTVMEATSILDIAIQVFHHLYERKEIQADHAKVCEEVHARKEAQRDISTGPQVRDQNTIRRWREKIDSACERNQLLANKFEDAQKSHDDHMRSVKDSGSRRRKTRTGRKAWFDRDHLKIARENMLASRKALQESETLLAQRAAREAESRKKFNEIQLELAKLDSDDVDVGKIIEILKMCVVNLTEFQEHLDKLVSFFSSLSAFVDIINQGHAEEFVAQVNNMVKVDEDTKGEDEAIRQKRRNYLRDSILLDALKLRGNYLVAGELASVYTDVSRKYIMPGVSQIERISLSANDASRSTSDAKSRQILLYARKAQSQVSVMAQKRREKLRDELYDKDRKIEELARDIEALDVSDYEEEWDEPDSTKT